MKTTVTGGGGRGASTIPVELVAEKTFRLLIVLPVIMATSTIVAGGLGIGCDARTLPGGPNIG